MCIHLRQRLSNLFISPSVSSRVPKPGMPMFGQGWGRGVGGCQDRIIMNHLRRGAEMKTRGARHMGTAASPAQGVGYRDEPGGRS